MKIIQQHYKDYLIMVNTNNKTVSSTSANIEQGLPRAWARSSRCQNLRPGNKNFNGEKKKYIFTTEWGSITNNNDNLLKKSKQVISQLLSTDQRVSQNKQTSQPVDTQCSTNGRLISQGQLSAQAYFVEWKGLDFRFAKQFKSWKIQHATTVRQNDRRRRISSPRRFRLLWQ